MQIPLIINSDNVLTLLKPYGKSLNFKMGEIVKAEVLNVLDSGEVSLRIIRKNGDFSILVAKSDIPLSKGSTVVFKVSASDAEIKLQFMGAASEGNKTVEAPMENSLQQKILKMLSEFAGSKLVRADLKLMEEVFKSLPDSFKAAFPEFKALDRIMPEIEKMNSELLRKSFEESGILFETKLKIAVQEQIKSGSPDSLNRMFSETDYKMELLKLKTALQEAQVLEALRSSGASPRDVIAAVDKLIRNLEFFQLSSQANNALYAFLPLAWQELKDGEMTFRKNRDEKNDSYTCDINLDLEPAGKLSVSVTLYEGSFYITFYAEDQRLKSLIQEEKDLLEMKFSDADMLLSVINIVQKKEISFGTVKKQGLNIKA